MLYRPNGTEKWQLVSDYILTTGGSKTDKIGKITVNNFKTGEYALGKRDVTANVNAVKYDKSELIQIFPNPAKNTIGITLKQPLMETHLTITDIGGRVVKSVLLKQENNMLDIGNLAKGQYYFIFDLADGLQISKSIVVDW